MLRLTAAGDLQSQTEGGKVLQILGWTETRKALEPKLTLWRGTDSNKVVEERTYIVGLRCCKRSVR